MKLYVPMSLCFLFMLSQQNARAVAAERTCTRIPSGVDLIAIGDSLTWGETIKFSGLPVENNQNKGEVMQRAEMPWPESLGYILGRSFKIFNLGRRGATSTDGLSIIRNTKNKSAVYFFMFGTNDEYLFRSGHPRGVSVSNYVVNMQLFLEEVSRRDSYLILIASPPLKDPQSDQNLNLYRDAQKKFASENDIQVIDLGILFEPNGSYWVDGAHLIPRKYVEIGELIASNLCFSR